MISAVSIFTDDFVKNYLITNKTCKINNNYKNWWVKSVKKINNKLSARSTQSIDKLSDYIDKDYKLFIDFEEMDKKCIV